MSKMLDNIRSLRDEVVQPFSECTGSGDAVQAGWGKGKAKKKRKKKTKRVDEVFSGWMNRVEAEVEEICGMGLEILEGVDWRGLFDHRMDPRAAAEYALNAAESEEDEDDDYDYFEEDEEGPQGAPGSLRRRSYDQSEVIEERAPVDPLDALIEEFRLESTPRTERAPVHRARSLGERVEAPEPPVQRTGRKLTPMMEVQQMMDEANLPEKDVRFLPVKRTPRSMPMGGPVEEEIIEDPMAGAFEAVGQIVAQERIEKENWKKQQELKQQQDADARARAKREEEDAGVSDDEGGDDDLDEASVLGGDYGRWKPATAAAGASGPGLAAAISKATGVKYSFKSDGDPSSSDVGSDLWFSIESSDQKAPMYFLGIKIKGDKENPSWDAMLKKGAGLGSASSVGSVRGVETSGLKGAIGQLKGKIKGKAESEGGE